MPEELTLEVLKRAVAGHAAAFRCVTQYQPAGGPADKIFPPTYEGGKYAVETRVVEGQKLQCVLLDSVQSQANRMELALLEAMLAGRINLPLLSVRFDQEGLQKKFIVTSLDAPHRVADAIFRDSLLNGQIFRKSAKGQILDNAEVKNAAGLFGLCPTALIFGLWDSTGPRRALGAKFQRALVSEMIGWDACEGVKTSSRIDPLQVMLDAGPLYERASKAEDAPDWTLDSKTALKEKGQPKKLGKKGKPSEANHGNVTPGVSMGGFTISKATQITVLSLPALRRLRFPLNGSAASTLEVDRAARTALAALGIAAAILTREEGADLRSRCLLVPVEDFSWELIDGPGNSPRQYVLNGNEAITLFEGALVEAREAGLPWDGVIPLTPSEELVKLVRLSQELAIHKPVEEID